jgi:hypothetical protein
VQKSSTVIKLKSLESDLTNNFKQSFAANGKLSRTERFHILILLGRWHVHRNKGCEDVNN